MLRVGNSTEGMLRLPSPSRITVLLQDIDGSATTRTANGSMHRDRVCGGATAKRKIEIEWAYPTDTVARQILQAFAAEFVHVEYFDPYEGGIRTAQFYTGDRSVPMYHYDSSGGVLWEKVKFNIIER